MATGTIKSPGWRLLWTNQNPSSNFANQTLALDLSPYQEARIVFQFNTTTFQFSTFFAFVHNVDARPSLNWDNAQMENGGKLTQRGWYPFLSGVVFDYAWFANTYGSNSQNNSYMIPLYIYAR